MWELDYEESWAPKNWCFWTVVLEKTLESPLDCKEIQPVRPKGDQSWVFIGRTDVEAETPILWPPEAESWLIGKDPDAGRDWGQEEKGTPEDEMVRWHHRFDGHGFGWTPRVGDGQGGLVCCGSGGCKESDMTEQLNWTELKHTNKWCKFCYLWWENKQKAWRAKKWKNSSAWDYLQVGCSGMASQRRWHLNWDLKGGQEPVLEKHILGEGDSTYRNSNTT